MEVGGGRKAFFFLIAFWQPVNAIEAHSKRQPHFVKLLQRLWSREKAHPFQSLWRGRTGCLAAWLPTGWSQPPARRHMAALSINKWGGSWLSIQPLLNFRAPSLSNSAQTNPGSSPPRQTPPGPAWPPSNKSWPAAVCHGAANTSEPGGQGSTVLISNTLRITESLRKGEKGFRLLSIP